MNKSTIDSATLEQLSSRLKDDIMGFKINHFTYLLREEPTSTNPLPWTHVYVLGDKITCSLRYIFGLFLEKMIIIVPNWPYCQ